MVPAVDFRKLEEVFVILEKREVPDDADFEAAQDESLFAGSPTRAAAEAP